MIKLVAPNILKHQTPSASQGSSIFYQPNYVSSFR